MNAEFPIQSKFTTEDIKPALKRNLFLTDVIKNEKHEECNEISKELNKRFSQYSWFYGLSLMGSNLRGYGTKSSDVDFKIFYDSSEMSMSRLAMIVKQHIKEVEELFGFESGHISVPYFVGFNHDLINKGLHDTEGRDQFKALLTLKDLSGPIVGDKVVEVRRKIKNILSQLQVERKREILDRVVDYAVQEEELGEKKLMQRLGMGNDEMGEFWEVRRNLWETHINDLWS